VKPSILPVNMDVPACLRMPVALHGAAFLLPMKLFSFMLRQCFIQRCPPPQVLIHKLAASQPYLRPLRFLLNFRHMRALVRYVAAQHLWQMLAIAGKNLGILRSA
jgi:hypothetical protein